MKNIYLQLAEYDTTVKGLVLATVVASSGSTPQKPGSSALFIDGRLIAGTVGGGIVENSVSLYAARCIEASESALLRFNLDKETEDPEEAVCGGMLSILVDSDPLRSSQVFREMAESLRAARPGVLVTRVVPWNDSTVLVSRCWATEECEPHVPGKDDERIASEVKNMLSAGARSGYRQLEMAIPGEEQRATVYLEPVSPPQRLIIAGAGHVGRAVSHQGRLLGFEVTVIDDRAEYANSQNLPDADNIIVRDIGEAMRELTKDPDTYIVIVTRGHSHDAEALRPCIGSGAAYVGMMGSKVKVAKMHEDFILKGWATEEQWERICTPIGIDIGSQTVEEIAVSIAAQLIINRGSRQ
ncbi:MAG: XdhC family protein [Bacteroidales bacterium]|jgi:xanthine dehydrogenase accessory factor|nr:XdhC family protein [Bacteroidales bacterium]